MRSKFSQAGWTKEGQLDKFLVTPSPVLSNPVDDSAIVTSTVTATIVTSTVNSDYTSSITETLNKQEPEHQDQDHNVDLTSEIVQDNSPINVATTPEIVEENYLPMTPKKSVLDPTYVSKNSPTIDVEENAYMEMSRGQCVPSLLDTTRHSPTATPEPQPYELFSFTESKIEPVYMEVSSSSDTPVLAPTESTVTDCNIEETKPGTPDTLAEPQTNNNRQDDIKSDSSDADDEASKDLDSLDTPFHPRFSLSDTFRPASYYLGASQVFAEFHDSSDSELVSPPPIPTSPPLTDILDIELNGSNYFGRHNSSTDYYANVSDADTISNSDNNPTVAPPLAYLSADNIKHQQQQHEQQQKQEQHRRRHEHRRRRHDNENESTGSPYDRRSCTNTNTNSDSDVEIRHNDTESTQGNATYYERMMKRRPVSDEFYDELESLDSKFHDVSIDRYQLDITETSNRTGGEEEEIDYTSDEIIRRDNGGRRPPYYCSDLMNNQRQAVSEGKRDIMRIVNPIRTDPKADNTFRLAAEARSVSVDFLNIADKTGQIDKKNIYESDTLKRAKAVAEVAGNKEVDTIETNTKTSVRRTHSLDGLLDTNEHEKRIEDEEIPDITTVTVPADESARVWEEDGLWRDRLRVVSQRHTRSLDGLDDIGGVEGDSRPQRHKRKLTRDVTYVNDNIAHLVTARQIVKDVSETPPERKSLNLIDRETLRQWDLMSSAPSDSAPNTPSVRHTNSNSSATVSVTQPSVSEFTGNAGLQGSGSKELVVVPLQHIDTRNQEAGT